ncbi:MAG: hypothetical protein EHM28_07265 [Spirochaetaceae bacterium]|nr:MAG: hypothetical protein EHM28_07265 [Spirochaetaceae bacterium]
MYTNAFLVASYPVMGYNSAAGKYVPTAWRAQAKSQTNYGVSVSAYAVGLKLVDRYQKFGSLFIPRDEVLKYVETTTAISDYTAHPTAIAYAPPGYSVVSGGAAVVSPLSQTGNYLTGSYYNGADYNGRGAWIASSKDHLVSSPSRIISYAICLPTNNHTDMSIPIFGDIREVYYYAKLNGQNLWETSTATAARAFKLSYFSGWGSDWCATSVGAYTEYYNGWGRMLKCLGFYIDNAQVFAADCDYGGDDWGVLHVQRISIELDDNEE